MCQVMSEYMNNSCTRVLGYLGTQGNQSLEYLNTRALEQLGTQGAQALGHSWHVILQAPYMLSWFLSKAFQKDLISKFPKIFC